MVFYIFLFFVLAVFLLGVWVLLVYRKRFVLTELQQNFVRSHWVRILDASDAYPHQAILDADKLIDYLLKNRGLDGTVAKKIQKVKALFSDYHSLRLAHKLRNKVAHELIALKPEEVKTALRAYKRSLRDLGAKI